MARLQRMQLLADSEQLADEIFKMRREVDNELRLVLARQRIGRSARGHEPIVQCRHRRP